MIKRRTKNHENNREYYNQRVLGLKKYNLYNEYDRFMKKEKSPLCYPPSTNSFSHDSTLDLNKSTLENNGRISYDYIFHDDNENDNEIDELEEIERNLSKKLKIINKKLKKLKKSAEQLYKEYSDEISPSTSGREKTLKQKNRKKKQKHNLNDSLTLEPVEFVFVKDSEKKTQKRRNYKTQKKFAKSKEDAELLYFCDVLGSIKGKSKNRNNRPNKYNYEIKSSYGQKNRSREREQKKRKRIFEKKMEKKRFYPIVYDEEEKRFSSHNISSPGNLSELLMGF